MSRDTRLNIVGLLFGIAFGGVLGASNLHEYDTIHSMLALDEFDVYWFMGAAIAVSAPLLWWLERRQTMTTFGGRLRLSRSRPEPRHFKGGVLFGLGWAVAGTCPAPALVMISSGAVLGLVAMAGIFVGLQLHQRSAGGEHTGDGEHRTIEVVSA